MRIRRAVDADRPAIARVQTESWVDTYRGLLPDDLLDVRLPAIMADRWANQEIGSSDAVLVAEDAGDILGFAATWDDEPAYIDNLHVVAGARSRGIGRRLLGETAQHFLDVGASSAALHVVTTNLRARNLYLALGGRSTGIEMRNLYGTMVANERILWDDLEVLLARSSASRGQGDA